MSTAIQAASAALSTLDDATMASLIAGGDCSRLAPAQRSAYYIARCEAAGLDPRAQPFQFVRLNGKEVLYATKGATDQLAGKHGIVCTIISQVTEHDLRTVTVRATAKDGRSQEDIGCVNVKGLSGEALANAYMKAVTKAKRRTILSLTGLGMLDETEIDTIPGAAPVEAKPVVQVVPATAPRTLEPGIDPPSMNSPPKKASPAVVARVSKLMKRSGMDGKEFGQFASEVVGRLVQSAADLSAEDMTEVEDEWNARNTTTSDDGVPF